MADGLQVFDTQTTLALNELEMVFQPCSVEQGELLFREGDPADGAWLIDAGSVQLTMGIPGRDDALIATVGPGDLLGEPALMRSGRRSLSARASTPVRAQFIDRRDFHGLLYGLRPVSFRLLERVARSTASYLADALAMTATLGGPTPPCAAGAESHRTPCAFDPRPFLAVLPFFSEMGPRDAEALLAAGTVFSMRRGQTVVSAGCPSTSVWVVLRGAVEVVPPGSGQRCSLLGPGLAVGVHPLLLKRSAPSHVRVREDAVLVEYTGEALSTLLEGGTRQSFKFVDAITRDLLRSLDRANRGLARTVLSQSLRGDGR